MSQALGGERHNASFAGWRIEDQIRWAEHNLAVMISHPEVREAKGLPTRKDMEVWLLRTRDHLTLGQLAIHFHGSVDAKSVSSVRRAIDRAEKKHWGTSEFVGISKEARDFLELRLLGVPSGV